MDTITNEVSVDRFHKMKFAVREMKCNRRGRRALKVVPTFLRHGRSLPLDLHVLVGFPPPHFSS
jgi:hypothetical protein